MLTSWPATAARLKNIAKNLMQLIWQFAIVVVVVVVVIYFISKNTKDTRANHSSEYIVILSMNFGILQCQLERRLRSDR